MNEWAKKRSVMRRYNLTAHIYDMRYAEEQTAKIKAALEDLSIEKRSLILDAGCGTGILFDYVVNEAETLVGLDISKKILLQAKKCVKNSKNTYLVLADVDNMPLKEKVFDYVFAVTMLQNTPKPVKTLNEFQRVAKDNATIVVTGMKKVFTMESFRKTLNDARLRMVDLKEEGLKCFVAICTLMKD
jgi:ubiquinone/menaquinone biosynthesis C-methylase UbiE